MKIYFSSFIKKAFTIVSLSLIVVTQSFAAGIVTGNQSAEFITPGLGTINFKTTNGTPIDVNGSGITGQAWGSHVGWIQMAGSNYGVSVNCNQSTQIATLGGFAWGQNTGWINFATTNGTPVTIDSGGRFHGFAWSQNYGWIEFDKNSCSTGLSPKCLQTNYRCTAPPSNGGGGGSINAPLCKLSAYPDNIIAGQQSILSWALGQSATQISVNGQTYLSSSSIRQIIVNPSASTTYTATVSDGIKTQTCSQAIIVEKSNNPNDIFGCMDKKAKNYNKFATKDEPKQCIYNKDPNVKDVIFLEDTGVVPAPTSDSCPYFKQWLKVGSKGNEVKKLQLFLNAHMRDNLDINGNYDKKVEAVVHRFQKKYYEDTISPWNKAFKSGNTTGRFYKTTKETAEIIIGCPAKKQWLEDVKVFEDFSKTVKRLFKSL
jgi:hypothetical protein